jgi:hypothetical protein
MRGSPSTGPTLENVPGYAARYCTLIVFSRSWSLDCPLSSCALRAALAKVAIRGIVISLAMSRRFAGFSWRSPFMTVIRSSLYRPGRIGLNRPAKTFARSSAMFFAPNGVLQVGQEGISLLKSASLPPQGAKSMNNICGRSLRETRLVKLQSATVTAVQADSNLGLSTVVSHANMGIHTSIPAGRSRPVCCKLVNEAAQSPHVTAVSIGPVHPPVHNSSPHVDTHSAPTFSRYCRGLSASKGQLGRQAATYNSGAM